MNNTFLSQLHFLLLRCQERTSEGDWYKMFHTAGCHLFQFEENCQLHFILSDTLRIRLLFFLSVFCHPEDDS